MSLTMLHGAIADTGFGGLRRMILDKGVVVIRNGHCGRDAFIRFSDHLGTDFVTVAADADKGRMGGGYSGRNIVDGIPSLFSVTGKGFSHAVPLHGELYFQQPDPPHLLWFYCRTPPDSGGETLFCDGEALFAALPVSIQQRLHDASLVYIRRLDADVWPEHYGTHDPAKVAIQCGAQGTEISCNEDGSMTTRFRSPAVRLRRGRPVFINNFLPFALREMRTPHATRAQVRLASGAMIPADEILQIESIAAALAMPVDWETGDIAIVDNTRVLHGRNPVNDSRREIYVRMSNADFIGSFLHGS